MGDHQWILEVIADMKEYSQRNGLFQFAAECANLEQKARQIFNTDLGSLNDQNHKNVDIDLKHSSLK